MQIVERKATVQLSNEEKEILINAKDIISKISELVEDNNYNKIECDMGSYYIEDLSRCEETLEEMANIYYLE